MKRPEITASSILIGLLVLLASCLPAQAAEVYIDVESDRAVPIFRILGAAPTRPWGHPLPVLDVQGIGEQRWRLRTRYPDEWGCSLMWIAEGILGEEGEMLPEVLTSENAILFGECPEPFQPVSEPPADLLAAAGAATVGALVWLRRPSPPSA
jgi:hypothetical protein